MNIGAIGWWSYQNQGDLAMLAALRQGLAPQKLVPIDTGFPAHPDAIARLNRLDYLLLGGGTLIAERPAPPFDTFDRWADQLTCPLGVVGLGVDPIAEASWPAVEAMLERARFWYVRDRQSRHNLRDHPKVQVAPDLTFALPLTARHVPSQDLPSLPVCGVNLRRSATDGLDPDPWVSALKSLPVRLKGLPLSPFRAFDERSLLQKLDPGTPHHHEPQAYRQVDLVIGTAYHAVLFAVQAAVPVIAIGYAPKVTQFMQENGLARWLLAPGDHTKLPALVDELLSERAEVTAYLAQLRDRLHHQARGAMQSLRHEISAAGPRAPRAVPRVTIAVVSSGDPDKDRRTLASCTSQTYANAQVFLVSATPPEDLGMRLRYTLGRSTGEYLGWILGGEWLAADAIACLVGRLTERPQCDVVYADYYAVDGSNLPVGHHVALDATKLFRRDVVGPCFLMRRHLLCTLLQLPEETPLLAYSLWLAASAEHKMAPFHAPLCYSARPIGSRAYVAKERTARRLWRVSQPALWQAAWHLIDSQLGERLLVQPVAWLCRTLGRSHHAQAQ